MTRKTYREREREEDVGAAGPKPERTSAKQARKTHHDGLGQSGQSKRR